LGVMRKELCMDCCGAFGFICTGKTGTPFDCNMAATEIVFFTGGITLSTS
jgi:hypothetical protein